MGGEGCSPYALLYTLGKYQSVSRLLARIVASSYAFVVYCITFNLLHILIYIHVILPLKIPHGEVVTKYVCM